MKKRKLKNVVVDVYYRRCFDSATTFRRFNSPAPKEALMDNQKKIAAIIDIIISAAITGAFLLGASPAASALPAEHIAPIAVILGIIALLCADMAAHHVIKAINAHAVRRAEMTYRSLAATKAKDLDEAERKLNLVKSEVKEAEKHLEALTTRTSRLNDFATMLRGTTIEEFRRLLPPIKKEDLNDLFESRKALETMVKRLSGLDVEELFSFIEEDGSRRTLYSVRNHGTYAESIVFHDFFGKNYSKLGKIVVNDKDDPLHRSYHRDPGQRTADLWQKHHLVPQDVDAEMARQETISLLRAQISALDEKIEETARTPLCALLAKVAESLQN